MRPAVSVHEELSNVDSAYDSPTSCDPAIFGESSLPDDVFASLFAADTTLDDNLHFFKDGFGTTTLDDEPTNGFVFDQLVDLDAGQSLTSANNKEDIDSTSQEDLTHSGEASLQDFSEDTDPSTQIAATSSSQQPFLGAPA